MRRYSKLLVAIMVLAGLFVASDSFAQKRRISKYTMDLEDKMDQKMKSLMKAKEAQGWKCVVSVGDSNDGNGQDAELRESKKTS